MKRAATGTVTFHGICDKIFSNVCEEDWPQGGALLNITNFNHIVNMSP